MARVGVIDVCNIIGMRLEGTNERRATLTGWHRITIVEFSGAKIAIYLN